MVTCRWHAAWQICWVIPNNQKHCYSCYECATQNSLYTKNLQTCTGWTSFLLWGSLHNLEQPESSRGCHNLNPYRHRHYAPEGYSCYTLDKPQGINVLLFLLFLLYCYGCVYKKPHPPGTFKLTQPDKVFYFGVPHNLQKPECSLGSHNLNPNRECLVWVFQHVEGYQMLSMLGMA